MGLNKGRPVYATEVVIKSNLYEIWRKYFVMDTKLKAVHLGTGAELAAKHVARDVLRENIKERNRT